MTEWLVLLTSTRLTLVDSLSENMVRMPVLLEILFNSSYFFRRLMLNLWRARVDLIVRLFTVGSFAFFVWIFLIQLGNDLSTIQDRAGVVYQSISVPPMVGVLTAVALCK